MAWICLMSYEINQFLKKEKNASVKYHPWYPEDRSVYVTLSLVAAWLLCVCAHPQKHACNVQAAGRDCFTRNFYTLLACPTLDFIYLFFWVKPSILIAITYPLRREATREQSHFLRFVHCYHTTLCNGVSAISCSTVLDILLQWNACWLQSIKYGDNTILVGSVRLTIDRGMMTY